MSDKRLNKSRMYLAYKAGAKEAVGLDDDEIESNFHEWFSRTEPALLYIEGRVEDEFGKQFLNSVVSDSE